MAWMTPTARLAMRSAHRDVHRPHSKDKGHPKRNITFTVHAIEPVRYRDRQELFALRARVQRPRLHPPEPRNRAHEGHTSEGNFNLGSRRQPDRTLFSLTLLGPHVDGISVKPYEG